MHIAKGCIKEIYFQGTRAACITCPPTLIPAPGQYLLAQADNPDSPLPYPIFIAASHSTGFFAAHSIPATWIPGTKLLLKGPLGKGFNLPPAARKVLLASWSNSPGRVLSLLETCHRQNAEVVLLSESAHEKIPLSVEILPFTALAETAQWADYAALDISREQLDNFIVDQPMLNTLTQLSGYAQIFIETPTPCGGMAECGVCAVSTRQGVRLACKDGPVFNLSEIIKHQK